LLSRAGTAPACDDTSVDATFIVTELRPTAPTGQNSPLVACVRHSRP
jgi:hypothetical protein